MGREIPPLTLGTSTDDMADAGYRRIPPGGCPPTVTIVDLTSSQMEHTSHTLAREGDKTHRSG